MRHTWGGTTVALGAALLLAAMTGCGSADEEAPAAALAGTGGWTEPADYTYTLLSECGERGGLGHFRITVRDGVAEEVTDLDEEREPGGEEQWHGEPLTIGELLAAADRAEEQGAEQVEVEREPGTGRPVAITIDYVEAAIDDEICYTMSDFTED